MVHKWMIGQKAWNRGDKILKKEKWKWKMKCTKRGEENDIDITWWRWRGRERTGIGLNWNNGNHGSRADGWREWMTSKREKERAKSSLGRRRQTKKRVSNECKMQRVKWERWISLLTTRSRSPISTLH